jgi:hypothetical protein
VGTPTHDRHDSDVIVAEEFSDGDIEEDTSATTPGEVRPPSPLSPKGNHHSALDFGVSAVVVSTPEAGSDSVVDSSKASQILASVPSFTSEVSVESLEAEVQAANSADVETPIEESTGDGVVSEDASKQPVTLSKVWGITWRFLCAHDWMCGSQAGGPIKVDVTAAEMQRAVGYQCQVVGRVEVCAGRGPESSENVRDFLCRLRPRFSLSVYVCVCGCTGWLKQRRL